MLGAQKQLVEESAQLEAQQYYKPASGALGSQTAARWKALTDFLFQNGLLTNSAGKPLAAEPDPASLFSNTYLPSS